MTVTAPRGCHSLALLRCMRLQRVYLQIITCCVSVESDDWYSLKCKHCAIPRESLVFVPHIQIKLAERDMRGSWAWS